MTAPCKNCNDRFVGCHGQCDRYKAFRADIDKDKKAVWNAKSNEELFRKRYRGKNDLETALRYKKSQGF